ncbi:MAG: GAF domain-containing protein [Anaerolineae bacterium]|nr:GAF domain-containing protein [Anaerolineae bacterium]
MAQPPQQDSILNLLEAYQYQKSRRWNLATIPVTIVITLVLVWVFMIVLGDMLTLKYPVIISGMGIVLGLVLGLAQRYYRKIQSVTLQKDTLTSHALMDAIVQIGNASATSNTQEELLETLHQALHTLFMPKYIEIATHYNGLDDYYISEAELILPGEDPFATWLTHQPVGEGISLPTDKPTSAQEQMRARGIVLLVPLGRQGWVGLSQPRNDTGYSPLALNILQRLAEATAAGLERLSIMDDQQKRAKELGAIYWMAQAVNFAMPLDDILELIYTQLNRVINIPNFRIALKSPDKDTLSFAFYVEGDERIYPDDEWSVSEGLTGYVLQNALTIRTKNYLKECQNRGIVPKLIPMGVPDNAWMAAPLSAGDNSIGVMIASAYDPEIQFTAEDESFFVTVAAYTASILERHTLYESLETRAQQLNALNEIGNLLASSLDLDKVLDLVVRNAGKLLNSAAGSLLLLDEGSGDLVFHVASGEAGPGLIGKHVPSGKGIVGVAFAETHPVIVNKTEEDQRWYDGVDKRSKFSTHSIIAVPLNARGRSIGVLELLNRNDGRAFNNEDAELLMAFGAQAAIAIENAQLFTTTDKALRARLEELTILQQIDRQLNATLDYREVMGQTLEWATRITDTSVGLIAALNEEEDGTIGLRLLAHKGYPQNIFERYAEEELWPLDKGLIGNTVLTGETTLVKDVSEDANYAQVIPGMQAQLTVPIEREERVIGVIALESAQAESFSEENVALISRLANHAAIAIENARLFQQVQRANEAKTEFVSFVSHELKQPMTSMKGYTDLLMKGIGGTLNDQQKQFLQVIRSNVERMGRIVSDLLDVTRIESGRLRLEMSDVVPADVMSEAVQAFEQAIAVKGQELKVEIEPNLPQIQGDRGRLLQVLTNLISNANKYTPEHGTITVSVGRWMDREQHYVRWAVRDTGVGMKPEELDRLFTKYFRSKNPEVRSEQGTGLGLVITRSIIEMHGGYIAVESEWQKGSTFSFVIPISGTAGP